ncbi:MBL fold metallo-hydrolase [Candidatus Saccharibacteria bacterium]|nr:MBL fold metallo-hydrolase [Candidatus Saccharibacteria bacterium]
MKITKLEHSGIIIEKDGKQIVFDPVEFNERISSLENVVAIVITHKHNDHLQPEIIAKIRNDNPQAKIFTTNDAAPLIDGAIIVKGRDSIEVDGFRLDFFGKDHAAIVPGQIPCENIGVVIDDEIVNPGDSFDLPNKEAKVLFVAISAPWLKIVESMKYVESARPNIVIPVHDALLSELGESISGNWMKKACDGVGAEYKELMPGESVII